MRSNPGTFRTAARRWLRRLGTALLPWTVVGCAAALTLTAGGSAERLSYVKALIWPVVAVVVVWSLRDLLRTKFGQVEQVDALGVAMKFRVEQQEAAERLEDVRDAIVELGTNEDSLEGQGAAGGEEAAVTLGDAERRRRAAIEALVRNAARLGFTLAGGKGAPPDVDVAWKDDGEPEIRFARSNPSIDEFGRALRFMLDEVLQDRKPENL